MNVKVRPVVASIATIVIFLVSSCSLSAAIDVESNNALSADTTVEINGGHIHYLGEFVICYELAFHKSMVSCFPSEYIITLCTTPLTDDERNIIPPSLGTCVNFGVLAGSQLKFNTSITILTTNSIGCTTPNSIIGNYKLSKGSVESATVAATTCMTDKNKAYNSKSRCRYGLTTELAGRSLSPNSYCSTSGRFTLRASSFFTLDAAGSQTAFWQFQTVTTLVTGLRSYIVLKNEAKASNVFWFIASTASIGESSFFVGNILSWKDITFGANCVVKGRGLSSTSVKFVSGSLVSLTADYDYANITLGLTCSKFAVFARSALDFGKGQSVFSTGSIGTAKVMTVTGNYDLKKGSCERGSIDSIDCDDEFEDMFNDGSILTCKNLFSSEELDDLILSPGVYCSSGGGFSIGQMGALVLDANYESDAIWVFQMSGKLVTGSSSSVILKNGARASRVFWIVGHSADIGYSSFFVGILS
jgi:hypothetical protein